MAVKVLRTVAGIADVHEWNAAEATAGVDLLIEVPHGATETADYADFAVEVRSPLPESLIDFFYVNTDVGAFETACAVAELLMARGLPWRIVVVRSRIPRTFVDCNRRMDARPEDFVAGGVTPGMPPWITDADDQRRLLARHAAYVSVVDEQVHRLNPAGRTLLLHTYAPRTVDVQVDHDVVTNLHRAWADDKVESWPLRPPFDVIARDTAGVSHAPTAVVEALTAGYGALGWEVADSACYPLHPSTLAWDHVMARPGRALCLEVRRDLLAEPFDPFVQMNISPQRVERVAGPLAEAIAHWS